MNEDSGSSEGVSILANAKLKRPGSPFFFFFDAGKKDLLPNSEIQSCTKIAMTEFARK